MKWLLLLVMISLSACYTPQRVNYQYVKCDSGHIHSIPIKRNISLAH